MTEPKLSFRFSFQPWEHYRALRAISNRGAMRVTTYLFGLVVPLAFLALTLMAQVTDPELPPPGFRDLWIVVFLPAVYFLLIPALYLWKAYRLQIDEPSKEGEQTRSLSAAGLKISGPRMSVDLSWDGIRRIIETREFFLFFGSKSCAMYIPKRLLAEPNGVQEARRLILENARQKARLHAV